MSHAVENAAGCKMLVGLRTSS